MSDPESLRAETNLLRIQFLECELGAAESMIRLAQIESADNAVQSRCIRLAQQALKTVRTFLDGVSPPEQRARIARRLDRLEAGLTRIVDKKQSGCT